MGDSAQAQVESQQPQVTASSTAVYNPLMAGEEQAAGMGGSVVEDLMSVYESMTKSKTPHPHSNHQQSKAMVQHAQFDTQLQSQHYGSPEQQHQMQPKFRWNRWHTFISRMKLACRKKPCGKSPFKHHLYWA